MANFFDNHYDLLTILQFAMDEKNKYYRPEMMFDLSKMYRKNNIIGSNINLFFMSKKEMIDEFDISTHNIDILKVFKETITLVENVKELEFIDPEIKFIYSIEGCDFVDIEQLEELYQLGLRSILLVWNNKNQYGSGFRTDEGLSEKGRKFICKAIELGIIIDVSHANEPTFYDMVECIKEAIKDNFQPIVIASHSNVRSLCDRKRNLTDDQIKTLRDIGGYLGLFTNGNFILNNNEECSKEERQDGFLKMIDYVLTTLDYPVDKIILSTDDMDYHPDNSYHHLGTFDLEKIAFQLEKLLLTKYDQNIVKKMMYKNSLDIYHQLDMSVAEKEKILTK